MRDESRKYREDHRGSFFELATYFFEKKRFCVPHFGMRIKSTLQLLTYQLKPISTSDE